MFEIMRDPVGAVRCLRLSSWLKTNPVTVFILAISVLWALQAGYTYADQNITANQGAPGNYGAWPVRTGSVTGQTCQQAVATAGGVALTVATANKLYEVIVEGGYGNVSIIAGNATACSAYATNGMLLNDGTDKYFLAGATNYSICAQGPVAGHPIVQLCY
jgi:hypothetical protein